MNKSLPGRPLRYVLVQLLHEHNGPMTVRELIAACEAHGVVFHARASKLISDALRWEVRRGRVIRLARGVYAFGAAPRSTMWGIRKRSRLILACFVDGYAGLPPSLVGRSSAFVPSAERWSPARPG